MDAPRFWSVFCRENHYPEAKEQFLAPSAAPDTHPFCVLGIDQDEWFRRVNMNVRDHLCTGWRLLRSATVLVGAVLPAMAAGVVALLVTYYAMEHGDVWQSAIGIGRDIYIPGSLLGGIFVAVATGVAAYSAYQKTRSHPLTSNSATIAGIATACTLISWPTHWCDLRGGVAAGLTAAGIVAAPAIVVGSQARRVRQNTVAGGDDSIGQSNTKPDQAYVGIVLFVQIALALIMVLVAYLAMTDEDLSGSRTKLLAFAGIGITAAASISPKLGLKTLLAAAGAVISFVGAYIEADQALTASDSEVEIWTLLIAAGIVAGALMWGLAFVSHIAIRILIAPFLAGAMAASIAVVVALIPAVFISVGCSLPATWGFVSILIAVAAGLIVGIGTVVGTAAIAIRSWWTTRSALPISRRWLP